MAKKDADPAEKMLGYGARGLSRSLAKDEAGALKDVNAGIDIVEETKYGMTGQLPVAATMLQFALGEIRKAKSEKISLNPPGDDFVLKLESRCALLLEAQQSYANAIRSVDVYWAAMSGYRVGELYAQLHKELMQIPPTQQAKTDSDKKLFYAIMHVRYRVLLEKGVDMMERTLALGDRTGTAPGVDGALEDGEGGDGEEPRRGAGDHREAPVHGGRGEQGDRADEAAPHREGIEEEIGGERFGECALPSSCARPARTSSARSLSSVMPRVGGSTSSTDAELYRLDRSGALQTPSPVGLGDSRYATLEQLLEKTDGKMGTPRGLSPADRTALLSYLKAL